MSKIVTADRIANTEPLPRILAPDLPRYVAHAIMKALEKNPDERFASADDLASAFMEEIAQAA